MNINFLTVHEIKKNIQETQATLDLSDNLLEIDDFAKNLIEELNKRYVNGRLKITYATFNETQSNSFPKGFVDYYTSQTPENFIQFSKVTITDLKARIESISSAKGGYLVFADYEEHGNFLGVFLIRNTTGMLFSKNSANVFKINPSVHVDFEKMAVACRINKNIFQNREQRYLSFITRKNEDLSNYFINWISSNDAKDNKTDTRLLYELLNKIDSPLDENGATIEKNIFLDSVFKFIKESSEQIVNVKLLSEHFFKDENFLPSKIDEYQLSLNTEFRADSNMLRKFIEIKVEAEKIKLYFPHRLFNDKIKIDENNNDLIIIESHELSEKLKSEIALNGM